MILDNEKKILERVFKGDVKGKNAFIFFGVVFKEKNLKNIQVKNILIDGEKGTIIYVLNEMTEILELLILSIKNFDDNFEKILLLFNSKKYNDLLKLRGDFAEAYYIKKYKGEKILCEQKFDIFNNDKYVEIKSFSKSNGMLTIKNSQIVDGVSIIACEVVMDNNGFSIIEIAKEIPDKVFSDNLINKYSGSVYENFKFSVPSIWEVFPKRVENLDPTIIDLVIIFSFNSIKKKELYAIQKY